MKSHKSYFWMYIILGYFILSFIFGIPYLFSERNKTFAINVFGETGFIIGFIVDVILLLLLFITIIGTVFKYKWAWSTALTYVLLNGLNLIFAVLLWFIMPEKIISGMNLIEGIDAKIPTAILYVITFVTALFSLFFWWFLGRYIYNHQEFFKK